MRIFLEPQPDGAQVVMGDGMARIGLDAAVQSGYGLRQTVQLVVGKAEGVQIAGIVRFTLQQRSGSFDFLKELFRSRFLRGRTVGTACDGDDDEYKKRSH